MDTYELKPFLTLAETLHFGRTSQACNLSPSALSRMIKRLEEELGCLLFERDNRSVKLTREGMLLKQYGSDILNRWQQLREELSGTEGELGGEISIYCSVTAAYSILSDILATFRRVYPGVHIKLQTGDAAGAIDKVVSEETEITVAALPENLSESLLFKSVVKTPLVFIGSARDPRLEDMVSTRAIQWRDVPLILPDKGLARRRVDSWFKRMGIQPSIYARVSGNEAILAMVNLGCGIGIAPRLVVEKSPFRDNLVELDVAHSLQPYNVGLCIKKRKIQSPQVKAFWELVPVV